MPIGKKKKWLKVKHKLIAISGTPGVGKSTLAKYLAKRLGYYRFDLHDYYDMISKGYDLKKHCYNIDLNKFRRFILKAKKEKNLVIDSHISHLLPKKDVDLCIVITCSNLKKLEKRLQKRGYSKQKIRENLDAEIFQVCLMEAKERKQKVVVVDCFGINKEKITKKIMTILK